MIFFKLGFLFCLCSFLFSCSNDVGINQSISAIVNDFPAIELLQVASGFDQPVQIVHAGDGSNRLFVVEKKGVVKIIANGPVLPNPFLNITGLVKSSGSEQGLKGATRLSYAFTNMHRSKQAIQIYFVVNMPAIVNILLGRQRSDEA